MDSLPKSYKKLSKKQLKDQLLRQMNDNILMNAENYALNKLQMSKEQHLQSAEHALDYKDKVIDRYKTLLSISIEDL
jgi:hypothetical protein